MDDERPSRRLRILDVRGSASTELVVDIPTLVGEAVLGPIKRKRYKFRVLHHAEGITTCLFSVVIENTENWLVVFKAGEQILFEPFLLDSTSRIFVRNDADFLFFGTHSMFGAVGSRRWILRCLSIRENTWLPNVIQLSDLAGREIGSTICFEIIDGYFYATSIDQNSFVNGELVLTSHYNCFRFRVNEPEIGKTQVMRKGHSWRRHNSEGPINDGWEFLQLEKDEASGKIHLIECRKEWLHGKSRSQRTYYMTEFVFPSDSAKVRPSEDPDEDMLDDMPDDVSDGESYSESDDEQPNLPRLPHNVHHGDDDTITPFYSRRKVHLSSYLRSSSTFFDLVDTAPTGDRCLHLRAGSRRLRPPLNLPNNRPDWKDQEDQEDQEYQGVQGGQRTTDKQIDLLYYPNQIFMWPPPSVSSDQDPQLDMIHNILDPPDYHGDITATSDERSVVYSIDSGVDDLKPLIYISFDPSAKLYGMQRPGALLPECVEGGLQWNDDNHTWNSEGGPNRLSRPIEEPTTEGKGKGKGKGKESDVDMSMGDSLQPSDAGLSFDNEPLPSLPPRDGDMPSWVWFERPMYRDLAGKLTFDKVRKART